MRTGYSFLPSVTVPIFRPAENSGIRESGDRVTRMWRHALSVRVPRT